jgi:hypothetical protein
MQVIRAGSKGIASMFSFFSDVRIKERSPERAAAFPVNMKKREHPGLLPLCIGDEEELPAGTQNYHLQPNQRVDIYAPPMPGQWIWFQVLLGMPPRSRVIV